tara:strand:- start:1072 stop:1260 length:189 start_codon:yes stop_codon:yes gene_type:complete
MNKQLTFKKENSNYIQRGNTMNGLLIDERTREINLRGIAEARKILAASRQSRDLDKPRVMAA